MAGGELSQMIREATGIELQREVIRLHAGLPAELTPTRHRAAASRCLVAPGAGVFDGLGGHALVRRLPGTVHIELEVRAGDRVRPAESNLDLLGHLIAVADAPGEASRCAEAALGHLRLDVRLDVRPDPRTD